jgi:dATP pyrophosphohydrolase
LPVTDCAHSNSFPIHPAWRDRYQQHVTTNLEHVYRLQCEQRPDIVLNEREHVACRWLDRDRAAAVAGSATNREAILRLVTQPGRRSS